MVGLFKALLPSLFLATFVVAQSFKITAPSSKIWWVAGGQNTLVWACNSDEAQADQKQTGGYFTVVIFHPKYFPQGFAIIAQEPNADCEKSISLDQLNQEPGENFTIALTDTRNNSNIFAISEPFEIKPLGSLYPSQVSSSASAAGGTATASSASASATHNSAALSSHSPSFFGLTGIIGLLTVGLF